jgi:3-oxoacyl-[acyl-carrier protein] reductase
MRSIAKEVGPFGITANTISLGAMESTQVIGIVNDATARSRRIRRYPVGRLGRVSDVVGAVNWLSSHGAEWVTGQTISINGGFVCAP